MGDSSRKEEIVYQYIFYKVFRKEEKITVLKQIKIQRDLNDAREISAV